ncbi:MAG: tRNA (adenosine(37)-N6)-threonylcarbamoyltransferase complex ATPase subunit type 1 TsaE [Oligoflexales bacterium]|nr:tRNA (adenosine(37)-N6)-threonylcarbamoyltransferase complex ATPase subunit type 1 TsaE [Oligoflexales bacterium]
MKIFFDKIVCSEDGLSGVVSRVSSALKGKEYFVMWLDGPMGAGKSTFVRHFLWNLGLDPGIPVLSPTYSIMNEYEIDGKWFAHVDLYRSEKNFSLAELGVLDAKDYTGVFVEWPEIAGSSNLISPSHILRIRYEGELERSYSLEG